MTIIAPSDRHGEPLALGREVTVATTMMGRRCYRAGVVTAIFAGYDGAAPMIRVMFSRYDEAIVGGEECEVMTT